jgi:hypothetical protein
MPRSALVRAKRPAGPVERIEVAKVECPRCQSVVYAMADGTTPRPHLRASVPGESGYRADVPTMQPCVAGDADESC